MQSIQPETVETGGLSRAARATKRSWAPIRCLYENTRCVDWDEIIAHVCAAFTEAAQGGSKSIVLTPNVLVSGVTPSMVCQRMQEEVCDVEFSVISMQHLDLLQWE